MPSSWSPSLRLELQFTGENINLWGEKLNAALSRADYAVAGWLTKPLTGDYALTTANGADDEARAAMIKFTGAGPFTVTVPSVSKSYVIWNACAASVTITTGAGPTVVLGAGDRGQVFTDGAGVYQDAIAGLPLRSYVDNLAWTYNAGNLPAQAGQGGSALFTNGAVAGWRPIQATDVAGLDSKIRKRALLYALIF